MESHLTQKQNILNFFSGNADSRVFAECPRSILCLLSLFWWPGPGQRRTPDGEHTIHVSYIYWIEEAMKSYIGSAVHHGIGVLKCSEWSKRWSKNLVFIFRELTKGLNAFALAGTHYGTRNICNGVPLPWARCFRVKLWRADIGWHSLWRNEVDVLGATFHVFATSHSVLY